jgi:DHA2 family methylenomycin A resistance protein-like MFS transporter
VAAFGALASGAAAQIVSGLRASTLVSAALVAGAAALALGAIHPARTDSH